MYIISERHDGNTSKTPFENKTDAERLLKKINDAGGTAILLEVGKNEKYNK